MKNYDVITGEGKTIISAIREMREEVCKKINNGWKLQGGVSITSVQNCYTRDYVYTASQAVTKKDD